MKKTAFALAALFLGAATMNAQDVFDKGSKVINVGVGFGGGWYSSEYTSIPTISASFEACIVDGLIKNRASIGVGGILSFKSAYYDGDYYKETWTDVTLGARGTFHFQPVSRLDTYAGLMLGYTVDSYDLEWKEGSTKYDVSSSDYGGFVHGEFIGVRYYFTPGFAVNAEVGAGIAAINVGVSFKF